MEADIPPEVKGWNWGAFLLNWIWGLGNGTYIALLALVPLVNVVMVFVLGAKGNEWAWKNKQWESVERFKSVQNKWAYAGLIMFIVSMVVGVCFGILIFQTVLTATQPPVDAADAFLGELSSGQIETAYHSTSANLQQSTSLQGFQSFVAGNPILTEIKGESFNKRSISGSHAAVSGMIYGNDGSSSPIRINEVQEGGQWKVDGLAL